MLACISEAFKLMFDFYPPAPDLRLPQRVRLQNIPGDPGSQQQRAAHQAADERLHGLGQGREEEDPAGLP